MRDVTPDFGGILRILETANVRYVLVGGLAMVAHGSSHVTQDIDIGYSREVMNTEALSSALAPYHPELRGVPPGLPFVLDQRTFKSAINLTLTTDLGPLDLLGEAAGVTSFDGLWHRAIIMEVYGVTVHVASIEDLIAMKQAAGRPKDQSHILELQALLKLTQEAGN